MILCECGEFIDDSIFKDYIKTSASPSTQTIGHAKCGLLFNFVDGNMPKKYSSRKELKGIAMKFIEKKKFDSKKIGRFLLEVDRLKSTENLPDIEILIAAYRNILKKEECPV